jgi:lipopolysaccharide transport system permease protein
MEKAEGEHWTEIIRPKSNLFSINLGEVFHYRDLLLMFIRRDFVATYKQTVLGPFWYIIQPVLTTLMFTVVFGNIAKISTDELPKSLFYIASLTIWGYFAECLTKTSSVFKDNSGIFGKVYFPRLVMPLSIVISNLVKFSIQFLLFSGFFIYYLYSGANIKPNMAAFLLPLLLLIMAGLGLGFGLIISAMTTKYRDLSFLISFGVQLLMYATPVIYPLSAIPEKYRYFIRMNPITSIVETFRYGFLGTGTFSIEALLYSFIFMVGIMGVGVVIFNKVEKSFMDTV